MGKHKGWCTNCRGRHYPPTGKKCKIQAMSESEDSQEELYEDNSPTTVTRNQKSQKSAGEKKKKSGGSSAQSDGGQNFKVKGTMVPGHSSASDQEDQPKTDGSCAGDVQVQILQELKRVNKRLDAVEERVVADGGDKQHSRKDISKLSKRHGFCSKNKSKMLYSSTDSSEDDSDLPTLSEMRMSNAVQRKIDEKINSLVRTQHLQGNDQNQKIKSKKGGGVDVIVSHKVSWPHEQILGGSTKQRISYDQLSLTQFVQGFVKNVLEEENQNYKENMLQYLADLMEDATDFSWASAKASHAVLLCEMERGSLKWSDTTRIDRIRRAHAQKLFQVKLGQKFRFQKALVLQSLSDECV